MLKTKKSQTLHPGGAKALPGQEDSMVVMLWMLWILFLLDECPATHILQASWRVATFNETDGLRKNIRDSIGGHYHHSLIYKTP